MKGNVKVPPADIILNLINDTKEADEMLLDYYEGYIITAATLPIYDVNGVCIGYNADHDLMQDMRLNVLKCIPLLRKKLSDHLSDSEAFIIIL